MRYALNLDSDSRILSATFEQYASEGMPIVDSLPNGNISDYKYSAGSYVYDPLPVTPEEPTWEERAEAQFLYTAIMTDTVIGE